MHAAKIETSERLQKVDLFLDDGHWHSTMEIIQRCYACAVNSIIAELRANGRAIECEQRGRIWYYRKKMNPQMELAL